jgi:hypothetical protein
MPQVSLDENRAMPIPGYRLRKATHQQDVQEDLVPFSFPLAQRL